MSMAVVMPKYGPLARLLEQRYAPPAWALFREVADHTGGGSRYADAVAVSLWRSRGLEVHGFECKVSRSDWLRELKDPAKSDPIQRFADRWWVVVGDAEIVKPGELPPTWGLLVARGDKLVAKVDAPKLEAEPLTKGFVAALVRRAHQNREAYGAERYEAGKAAAKVQRAAPETEHALALVKSELQELTNRIAEFEKASGVSIDRYSGGDIGAAVKRLRWLQRTPDAAAAAVAAAKRLLASAEAEYEAIGLVGSEMEEAG